MPKFIQDIGHSSIVVGGISAIVATMLLTFGQEEVEEVEGRAKPLEIRESPGRDK